MNTLWALAREHRLHVVEDCAHALGARYQGWPIGAGNPARGDYSAACAFSFYATKNITTGEGGMVTTHSESLASAMKVLCLHGMSRDAWNRYSERGDWYYEVLTPGFKYNLTDIQSSLGLHQLRKLEKFLRAREQLVARYNERLADVAEVELPPTSPETRHAWHLYMLRLNLERLEIGRAEFIAQLRERGVGTSVHFIPIPLHPFFAPFANLPRNECPRALALYPRLVSLPLFPAMTMADVDYVVAAIKGVIREARKTKSVFAGVGD